MQCDVAIIGAGIAGLATAARLQSAGLTTIVFESHGQPGGCAGFFRRGGFSFDVGATTLVDFAPGGVGGELLEAIGMKTIRGETLPGYQAWLPDRQVTLYRDRRLWEQERLRALGDSPRHQEFWRLIDRLSDVFWRASRRGVKLPIRSLTDAVRAFRCVGIRDLGNVRFLNWTMGDALRHCGLQCDSALVGLLSMVIEDTVHSSVDEAPLINAALGITIRGAGLTRAEGGMRGFWREFVRYYRTLGGRLLVGNPVQRVTRSGEGFIVESRRGHFAARQVVSAVPLGLTAKLGPPEVQTALQPFVDRDAKSQGGAVVVFLGVPEDEVRGQPFTHHQLLFDYAQPLGNGNNMFLSVSAAGDTQSAPAGRRAVMISTHCDLSPWEDLSPQEYQREKRRLGRRLVNLARRVYPDLGRRAVIHEIATPRTFERFTGRPRGAVGGVRQTLDNANQAAVPHDVGCPGFWQVGDSTWPGLGTVACVLGSRVVAEGVLGSLKTRKNAKARNSHVEASRETAPVAGKGTARVA